MGGVAGIVMGQDAGVETTQIGDSRLVSAEIEKIAVKLESPHADKVFVAKDYTKADLIKELRDVARRRRRMNPAMIEIAAKAAYEAMVIRSPPFPGWVDLGWDAQPEKLREDWCAAIGAALASVCALDKELSA